MYVARQIYVFFTLAFIILWPSLSVAQRNFIIDTDVAIDDVIAILYILNQKDITVQAITIESNGNAHCKPAYANIEGILKVTQHLGIPVACGSDKPLAGNHHFTKQVLDDCDRLGGSGFSAEHVSLPKRSAKELMVSVLQDAAEPLDILSIGPMTTIAEVITAHPELKSKIRRIFAMGGAISAAGNIKEVDPSSTNDSAEWNIYIDPLAAQIVFKSSIPITLVPLDATNQSPFNKNAYKLFEKSHSSPGANFIYKALVNYRDLLNGGWYFWDPMAAVVAVDDSFCKFKNMKLSVRLKPESLSGSTVIDNQLGGKVRVCLDIDDSKFKRLLINGLNG